ncbi:CARDB domain-containing protein, partial [Chloroflexota bacterium]
LSMLSISPAEVEIGKEVTVNVTITNAGDQSGSYEATLKVNNTVVETTETTLAAGTSKEVTFTTAMDTAGTYTVDVNGKTGTFVVKETRSWWGNVTDNISNWWGNVTDNISNWWKNVIGK